MSKLELCFYTFQAGGKSEYESQGDLVPRKFFGLTIAPGWEIYWLPISAAGKGQKQKLTPTQC